MSIITSLKIYTDGACSGNPGNGGWGFAIITDGAVSFSNAAFFDYTTNNKMELSSVIEGLTYVLTHLPDVTHVTVHTDSAYTMNAMKDWVHNWRKKGWRKSDGKIIENLELMQQLYSLCYEKDLHIEWVKVKAHQTKGSKHYDEFNDYVDQLATGKLAPKNNG